MRTRGTKEAPVHRYDLGAVAGASGSAGVFASFANPFGRDVIVHDLILDIATVATVAAVVDAGIAANAATAADNLIDGLDVNAATGMFSTSVNPGANGKAPRKWGASQFLNIEEDTGNVNGLVAKAYVVYSLL